MALPQQSPIGTILVAAKNYLNEQLYNSEGYVIIGRNNEPNPPYIAESYIKIYPSGLLLDSRVGPGAGVKYMNLSRMLHVQMCTRISLDVAGEAEIELANLDYGLLALEENVLNIMQQKNLFDSDGIKLLNQPMRVVENPDILKDDKPADDFAWSFLSFVLDYSLVTDRTY